MYQGYLAIGPGDPINGGEMTELVNNARAYAYAEDAGLCWLQECTTCPETLVIVPGSAQSYTNPVDDGAPWVDPDNPDTHDFLGVIGLEIVGDESSTRNVPVSNAVTKGGVIGPPYFSYRTLVLRGIAIAKDECSLQAGLEWLNFASVGVDSPCVGDSLTFFDCCPCVCQDDQPAGPCWVETYSEYLTGPSCNPTWWPSTYAELRGGPPSSAEEWCLWPRNYTELTEGPPSWGCCVEACVVPYLRQYHNVAITSGPIILQHPALHSQGALVEFEMTLVAADPDKHTIPLNRGWTDAFGSEPVSPEPTLAALAAPTDPFAIPGVTTIGGIAKLLTPPAPDPWAGDPLPSSWMRDSHTMNDWTDYQVMAKMNPVVELTTFDDPAPKMRVGVWDGDVRVAGWYIPFIPAQSELSISASRSEVVVVSGGTERVLANFVRDWDGGPAKYPALPHGNYTVTLDQEDGKQVHVLLGTRSAAVAR